MLQSNFEPMSVFGDAVDQGTELEFAGAHDEWAKYDS